MTYTVWVKCNWYPGFDDTDTVDVVSYIECDMADITFVFSCVWRRVSCVWCHAFIGCNVVSTMVWTQRVDAMYFLVPKKSYISGCDVIHTVVQRSYLEWLWGLRYSGYSVRYRGSDDMNTTHVMSSIMWRDVINSGCDNLYSVSDVLHIVGAMSYIKRVWYHWKSGWETQEQCLWWYKHS